MDNRYLFRGKCYETDNWRYGSIFWVGPSLWVVPNVLVVDAVVNACVRIKKDTLGQSTGLYAAKSYRGESEEDRLIFEGDILDEDGYKFVVVYDQKNAKFKLQHGKIYQYPEWNRGVMMEIIGTVFDEQEGKE